MHSIESGISRFTYAQLRVRGLVGNTDMPFARPLRQLQPVTPIWNVP